MKFDAIRTRSAPEVLVQQIVRQIEGGELKTGSCLPSQRQLAKMFNVGLGTVRESIKILHVMGYLKVVQGKGTFVSENAADTEKRNSRLDKVLAAVSLADLMEVRKIVECEGAFLAAKNADAESIQRLKRITDDMEASFKDKQAFYNLDFDFHIAVAEASNNKVLFEIVKLLVDKAHGHESFMDKSLGISISSNVQKAVETARNVFSHIASGDGKGAREEMYRHLNIVNFELEKEFLAEEDARALRLKPSNRRNDA